jgi:hypothetical protein
MMHRMLRLELLVSVFLLASCASKKDQPKPRVAEKNYKVVDFSESIRPAWLDDVTKGDSEQAQKDHRYFISESEHQDKRLCLKSAEVRATATVASEIAQFIKNTYGESTQGEEDAVSTYMQESLAQEVQAFVVGAQVHKTYWELRSYQKDLGAEKDYQKYACQALVKMKKAALEKAIKNSTAELYKAIQNPEAKENTKKILQDVAQKFNEAKQ